ncbi:MAG: GNAT family N-acetyltransferase [Lachnospiraceae bacterium]|nr:GNAT family N-acetyltransferase [Lachnospiraceae bacterium]
MQGVIDLVLVTAGDVELLYRLQLAAFMPLYEKYHDDETSPAKETLERITEKITAPNSEFYLIRFAGKAVGGIRIRHGQSDIMQSDVNWISPFFVVPEFQNRGIGGKAIRKIFEMYPETLAWKLNTIKQERGNCHLYEKCGFVKTGTEYAVNEQMTLIDYERTCF